MPSSEEENPHLWVNLLSVNEHFEGERNEKRAFLVSLAILLKHQLSELLGTVKAGLFPFNRIP